MFLHLFVLSLAGLVSSDLASLRRFAEGGPAPLAKPSSEPFSANTLVPASSAPVLKPISKSAVVPGDVTPTSGDFRQQSTPTFIPGVPYGARQVGGNSFFPFKVKNVATPNNLQPSNKIAPPHASLVDIIQTSTTPPPTAAQVSTSSPPPTSAPVSATPPPTAVPVSSPPSTAAPVSSQHSKSLEQHAKLLEQHAKLLEQHHTKSLVQHSKLPEQHAKLLEQHTKSHEAELGLVRLSKSRRVNTPAVASTPLPTSGIPVHPQPVKPQDSTYVQDSAAPLPDRSAVDVSVAPVTEVTREQLEEELKAAVRLLRGNWDFVKKGGRLVLTDDENPVVISKSTRQ